jgi:hypothetical protein
MKAYREAFELGIYTRRRAAREIGGGKFSRIIKEREREDEMMRNAKLISSSQTHTVGEDPPDPQESLQDVGNRGNDEEAA